MPNPPLKNLLHKPMTRKEFLGLSVFALASLFGIVGIIEELKSHAATPFLSEEAENGTLKSPATLITDTAASAGKAVKFGPTPTPTPTTTTKRTWLSGYAGDTSSAGRSAFQSISGFAPQVLMNYADSVSFATAASDVGNYKNNGWYLPSGAAGSKQLNIITIGLVGSGGNSNGGGLASAAAGDDIAAWTSIGEAILNAGMNFWSTIIRLAHEANTGYESWGVVVNNVVNTTLVSQYKSAWINAVTAVRAHAPNVRFELCYNGNFTSCDPSLLYAGDSYVDIVGFDIYGDPTGTSSPSFSTVIPYCHTHNKLFSVSEWAPGSGSAAADDATVPQKMFSELVAADTQYPGIVSHDSYFNEGGWALSGLTNTRAQYKSLWTS